MARLDHHRRADADGAEDGAAHRAAPDTIGAPEPAPPFPAGSGAPAGIVVGTCRATCAVSAPDPAWDALVESVEGGDLVQTTLWAASRQRLGFRAYRMTVAQADGALAGGCVMHAKRLAPGVWAGAVPRGPLVFRPETAPAVVQGIMRLAWRQGVRFLVMQPPEGAAALEAAMDAAGFRPGVPSVAPEATLRLDLRRSDEELLAAMTPKRRQLVRKALRAGIAVAEERDIALFHRLHAATAQRQGFPAISPENLRAQYEVLEPRGLCAMFVARHGGEPVAGLWVTRFGGTVTSKLAGWNAAGPAAPNANEAVLWTAIQWARAQGAHSYDLGGFDRRAAERIVAGEPLPEGFQQSPGFFKLGFGGTPVLLPPARFAFTQDIANRALGGATQYFLTTPAARRVMQRLRNG